jgi:hypothetical protein
LVALLVSIGAVLVVDRSTSLVEDWELIPGRPIVRVGLWLALVGLPIAFVVRVARRQPRLAEPVDVSGARSDALTASSFVLAVGLAVVVLVVLPVGNFVAVSVRNYAPAVVFLEDVILAAFALTLIGQIRGATRWSARAVAFAAVLVVVGAYWAAYQGKLAMRYPPREIAVASALRGNTALSGAAFIAPDLPQVVWYYTRGRALTADPGPDGGPAFVVCARSPSDLPAPAPVPCGQWSATLDSAASVVGPGRTLYRTSDYAILPLQPCADTACDARAASAPTLEPLDNSANSSAVALTVTLEPTESLAHVDYQYAQAGGTPETNSVVQLYALRSGGSWCLIQESVGGHDLQFPPTSAGQLRAAVIPRSALAIGQPYFSDPQQVQTPYVVDLPNTRDGGMQHIQANSLEEAEQQALAAGTWNPGAGTLGPDSRHLLVQAPTADEQCRN